MTGHSLFKFGVTKLGYPKMFEVPRRTWRVDFGS